MTQTDVFSSTDISVKPLNSKMTMRHKDLDKESDCDGSLSVPVRLDDSTELYQCEKCKQTVTRPSK